MQRPKIDMQAKKLADLLHEMRSGQLQVPRFQRDFVWPLTKTRALLDSMYKNIQTIQKKMMKLITNPKNFLRMRV